MSERLLPRSLTLAVALLGTTACVRATLRPIAPIDTGVKRHAVFVDHDGRALTPRVDSGASMLDGTSYGAYLHQMLDSVRSSGKHHILLWIHGGLVDLGEGLDITRRIVRDMAADSTQRDVYPIAINWESALLSSYDEHLLSLRQGVRETRPLAIALTTPFYLAADLGRALTRAPIVWFGQGTRFLQRDYPVRVREAEDRLTAAMDSTIVPATGEHPGAIALSIGEYNGTGAETFIRYATLPFVPFKMLGTFLIDGTGVPGWEVMRRRTKTMYRSTGEWRAADTSAHYLRPTGAVSILLDSLVALVAPTPLGTTHLRSSGTAWARSWRQKRFVRTPSCHCRPWCSWPALRPSKNSTSASSRTWKRTTRPASIT
jgi:hypothetical protein